MLFCRGGASFGVGLMVDRAQLGDMMVPMPVSGLVSTLGDANLDILSISGIHVHTVRTGWALGSYDLHSS